MEKSDVHTIADRGSSKRQHEAGKEPKPVTPQSPKPGRSPLLRRNGSLGKGPTKTTVPQGFKLATEARSLIRPCGCGKDGVFSPHVHGQGHAHHKKAHAGPELSNRGSKAPKSPQITRRAREALAVEEPKVKMPQISKKVAQKSSSLPIPTKPSAPPAKPSLTKMAPTPPPKPFAKEDGTANRFVSTVVWYPEMQPEFNSTRLKLGPGEDTYQVVDQILVKEYDSYIKKRSQDFKNQSSTLNGPLHVKKVEANNFEKMIEGCLSSGNVKSAVSIS